MKLTSWIAVLALASTGDILAQAPKFPVKPVRMVVGFAPGGATDIIARSVASGMTDTLGQQVIVENRPGASSQIAGELVAKSPPDGHTLMMVTQTLMTSQMIEGKSYPDLVKDFSHVALSATSTLMLVVTPTLPVKSVKELVALARARPGDLTYASGGVGTTPHLAGELLITMARLKMVHVPYKGEAPGLIDVIGGHVPMMFTNISASSGFVKDGRLRALAVTSLKPTPAMPGVPSLADSGLPGFEVIGFFGVLAAAGTPREFVTRLNGEINKALARPEVTKNFAAQALEPQNRTAEQFSDYIKSEAGKWGKLIRDAGIK